MSIKFFFIVLISSTIISSCISQEELQSYLIKQIVGDEISNSEIDDASRFEEKLLTTELTATQIPSTVTPTPTVTPTATQIPPTVIPTPTAEPTATQIPPTVTATPEPYEYFIIANVNLGLEGKGLINEKRVVNLSGGGYEGLDQINDSVYVYLETEDSKFPLVSNMQNVIFFVPGTNTEIRGLITSLWTSGDVKTPTVIKVQRLNKVGNPDVWAVDPKFAGGRGPKNYRGLVDISIKVKKY